MIIIYLHLWFKFPEKRIYYSAFHISCNIHSVYYISYYFHIITDMIKIFFANAWNTYIQTKMCVM